MKRRRKIVIQGIAGMVISTIGILAIGIPLTATKTRTIALEYREEPIEIERERRPTAARRPAIRPPAEEPPAAEEEAGPPAPVPRNGDGEGILDGIARSMIDNAISTFWGIVNALIVAVTMRRYSKAGREAPDG